MQYPELASSFSAGFTKMPTRLKSLSFECECPSASRSLSLSVKKSLSRRLLSILLFYCLSLDLYLSTKQDYEIGFFIFSLAWEKMD